MTTCSSVSSSGTGNNIEVWAGNRSAYPPVASLDTPEWMPALMVAGEEVVTKAESPASHDGHSGDTPRACTTATG